MRFMVETDLKLSGCVSADTLAALRAEGYDYKDGNLVPAGKEETMQEKVANTTPAAPLKLDVSVRVIEPVKNLMGFASVKFNDCFVVENLKINSRRAGKPAGRKPEKQGLTGLFTKGKNIPTTAQQTLPYREMYRDGVCRVANRYYTKTIEYEDINYQLAQSEDQAAIFLYDAGAPHGWRSRLLRAQRTFP